MEFRFGVKRDGFKDKVNLWDKGSGLYILDHKKGDVNGDGIIDNIYLIGRKPFDTESPFNENITLIIQDGKTSYYTPVPLKVNVGYDPKLFLGDFTGDKLDDIFITIYSGGSGGYTYYYMYTFKDNDPKNIFDFEMFNEKYKYDINYEDEYKVRVYDKTLKTNYLIDLSCRDKEYLSNIYDERGKIKSNISGFVLPLGALYPIDINQDGILDLLAIQRVAGLYNADSIGTINTAMKFEEDSFNLLYRTLSIYGCEQK